MRIKHNKFRNTGVLFEKTDQEILFVEKNDTLYEKNHTVNEYEINLNTDITKMINDFTWLEEQFNERCRKD